MSDEEELELQQRTAEQIARRCLALLVVIEHAYSKPDRPLPFLRPAFSASRSFTVSRPARGGGPPSNQAPQPAANSAFRSRFGSLLASTLGASAISAAPLSAAERPIQTTFELVSPRSRFLSRDGSNLVLFHSGWGDGLYRVVGGSAPVIF